MNGCPSSPAPHAPSPRDRATSTIDGAPNRGESSPQSSPQSGESSPQSLVARVARGRWAPAEDVRSAILAICEHEFRTVGDIASLLHRKATTIQQNYVSKMLDEGLLEARYPHTPNHPSQAYRARWRDDGADT